LRTFFRLVTVAEDTEIDTFITTNNKFGKKISTKLCAFYNIMKLSSMQSIAVFTNISLKGECCTRHCIT
jgi:hypothetical protein